MQQNLFGRLGIYLAGFLALMACQGGKTNQKEDCQEAVPQAIEIKYAQNFMLDDSNLDMRLLTIKNSESKHATEYHYALVSRQADLSKVPDGYEVVHIPAERFICMTSLQLSNFIALGITDKVVGITSTRHLFNKELNQQLAKGATVKIGIEGEFDNEMVLAANPQLILVSPSKRGGFDVLKESGMPIMPHMGYQEPNPLGQAEWVKLIGVLTGQEKEAKAYFEQVEKEYNELKQKVADAAKASEKEMPTIFSGDMKGGAWYATGGKSYLAAVFRDAGVNYILSDNEDTGGVNLDFETIYAKAADVDYWRISNSFDGDFGYNTLKQQDSRFSDFKAFRERHVIYCNMSKTPFYESFPVHPNLVLSDFVHIFYPDILPDYQPTYYKLISQ